MLPRARAKILNSLGLLRIQVLEDSPQAVLRKVKQRRLCRSSRLAFCPEHKCLSISAKRASSRETSLTYWHSYPSEAAQTVRVEVTKQAVPVQAESCKSKLAGLREEIMLEYLLVPKSLWSRRSAIYLTLSLSW